VKDLVKNVTTKLDITIEHTDREGELRSLKAWLAADELLVGTAPDLVSSRATREGEMGSLLDVLQLVVGGTIGAADLALGIATWRRSRGEPPTVELNQGGFAITLRGGTDDDLRRLAMFLAAGENRDRENRDGDRAHDVADPGADEEHDSHAGDGGEGGDGNSEREG
jgi:membrane-associated two-gene conflict system component 1 (EACC1)